MQLPIYEAIKGLPRLPGYTQIRAQILGAGGQNVAQAGAASEGNESAKAPVNGGVCHALAQCGGAGGNGASEGIRTLDTHVGNVMLYQAELRSRPKLPGQTTGIPSECKSRFAKKLLGQGRIQDSWKP